MLVHGHPYNNEPYKKCTRKCAYTLTHIIKHFNEPHNKCSVARNSLHMKGQAADLRLKSRSVSQMARAALSCRAGGVGKYRNANFVHMDCGDIRSWSR